MDAIARFPITVYVDGNPYRGSYMFEDGVVTVECHWGTQARHAPPAEAAVTARVLLQEIIAQVKASGNL